MLKNLKINFLGDSITEGVGTTEEDRFTSLLERRYGAICRNYGISGTRIARQTQPSDEPSFDLDFPSRVAEMDSDADVVVVFGGTNDYGHGDAPFGKFSDRTVDTFCGGLHVLFSGLIEKYPESLIVILTPLHRLDEVKPDGENRRLDKPDELREYVYAIREAAEYYSLPVLDLYACSGLQPNVPAILKRYVPDGLHPNSAGHEILAEMIADFLTAQRGYLKGRSRI